MTLRCLNTHSMDSKPTRVLAHVHYYEGHDSEQVLRDLLTQRFTGPVTLNISSGRVASLEWREKVRPNIEHS
jgi:hypothetical protein